VLRKTFGPKRVVVTGCWRKMQNWELHDLCCLPNIFQGTNHRDKRKAYTVLVWKPEETGWEGVEMKNLDLDRYKQQALAHLLMNFQVPHIVENFSTV